MKRLISVMLILAFSLVIKAAVFADNTITSSPYVFKDENGYIYTFSKYSTEEPPSELGFEIGGEKYLIKNEGEGSNNQFQKALSSNAFGIGILDPSNKLNSSYSVAPYAIVGGNKFNGTDIAINKEGVKQFYVQTRVDNIVTDDVELNYNGSAYGMSLLNGSGITSMVYGRARWDPKLTYAFMKLDLSEIDEVNLARNKNINLNFTIEPFFYYTDYIEAGIYNANLPSNWTDDTITTDIINNDNVESLLTKEISRIYLTPTDEATPTSGGSGYDDVQYTYSIDLTDYILDCLDNDNLTPTIAIKSIHIDHLVDIFDAGDIDVKTGMRIKTVDYQWDHPFLFYNDLNKPSADLADIKVEGSSLTSFFSNKYEYNIKLDDTQTTVPEVAAFASDYVTVDIIPATEIPGTTKVITTSNTGAKKIYRVNFSYRTSTIQTVENGIDSMTSYLTNGTKVDIPYEGTTNLEYKASHKASSYTPPAIFVKLDLTKFAGADLTKPINLNMKEFFVYSKDNIDLKLNTYNVSDSLNDLSFGDVTATQLLNTINLPANDLIGNTIIPATADYLKKQFNSDIVEAITDGILAGDDYATIMVIFDVSNLSEAELEQFQYIARFKESSQYSVSAYFYNN